MNSSTSQVQQDRNGKVSGPETGFSPFVVIGAAKSGTTWLQKTLNLHPEICCHFQRLIFPVTGRLRRELLLRIPPVYNKQHSPYSGLFADERAEEAYELSRVYLLQMDLLKPEYLEKYRPAAKPESFRELEQFHAQCVRGMVERLMTHDTAKPIVGTKAFTDIDQLFRFFPQAKLIHIVRDGRDVAVSKRFHYLRQGAYYQGDGRSLWLRSLHSTPVGRYLSRLLSSRTQLIGEKSFRTPGTDAPLLSPAILKKLAGEWKNFVAYNQGYALRRPDQFLTIKYEDMRAQPELEIRRALAFLGATLNDQLVAEIAEAASFKNLAKGEFFRKGTSGDWLNHFTDQNKRDFAQIAGQVLIDMKYEATADWAR